MISGQMFKRRISKILKDVTFLVVEKDREKIRILYLNKIMNLF